eukprot:GHVR01180405.1.p1 GENE.GHVR01180405.1~~GHVR01180405.1.p1  ORF type:complete len:126 (-),score=16.16 GHVR01180405.1:123-500(-)
MYLELVQPLSELNTHTHTQRIVRDMENLCINNPTVSYAWGDIIPALRFFRESTDVTVPTGSVADAPLEILTEQPPAATYEIVQPMKYNNWRDLEDGKDHRGYLHLISLLVKYTFTGKSSINYRWY